MASLQRYQAATAFRWTIVNSIVLIAVMLSTAIAMVQSRNPERQIGTAVIDDYEETEDPLEPAWTPPRVQCNSEIRQRCCHLTAHSRRDGSVKVSKAGGCPSKYVMQCCPGLKPKTRAESSLKVTLEDVLKCIQDLIENLLEFKFSLKGSNQSCCRIPLVKSACSPS